jgi:hypothetical protein
MNSGRWLPRFSFFPTKSFSKISFQQWWEQIIIRDQLGNEFSRRSLILDLAEKDGGVHLDKKLKADYKELSRLNSLSITKNLNGGKGEQPVDNPVPATIRQIAEEVLQTFSEMLSEKIQNS